MSHLDSSGLDLAFDTREAYEEQLQLVASTGQKLTVQTCLSNVRGHWVFDHPSGRGLIYDRFTVDFIRTPDGWLIVGTATNSAGSGRTAYNLKYTQASDSLEWTAIGLRHTFTNVSSDSAEVQLAADLDQRAVALIVRAYRIPFQGSVYSITNGSYLVASTT